MMVEWKEPGNKGGLKYYLMDLRKFCLKENHERGMLQARRVLMAHT